MDSIKRLNARYEEKLRVYNGFDRIRRRLMGVQSDYTNTSEEKLFTSLNIFEEYPTKEDLKQFPQIIDFISLGGKYRTVLKSLKDYEFAFRKASANDKNELFNSLKNLTIAKSKFEEDKNSYLSKYGKDINNLDSINKEMTIIFDSVLKKLNSDLNVMKKEAKELTKNEETIYLSSSDYVLNESVLPEDILVGKIKTTRKALTVLNDIGVGKAFEPVTVDFKTQGNVLLKTTFDQMDTLKIDEFVLAYIFKILQSFPIGMINIHLFDKNPYYLYRSLVNSFQRENMDEATKKTVQIHSNIKDLNDFENVICNDIFKKTSPSIPDLYAIHKSDNSDPFNLVILRDGILDTNGFAPSDILDTIKSLSDPSNMGHKCGLRFLIVEQSFSDTKNINPATLNTLKVIEDNCSLRVTFDHDKYIQNNEEINVLQIVDNRDEFVSTQSQKIADTISKRVKSVVSVEDVANKEKHQKMESIMYIPVGKSGTNMVELPLSCKDLNNTLDGQCIGYMAIGQSGSGKSSFFHSLVLNGCLKYSPKDLQFWLLDFKNGGASSKYRNSGIPHIRIIAEDNKVDDAFCLFQMISEEMERRNKLFNKNFVDNIIDYNNIVQNKNNMEYLPRVIIAIDEIQEIFRDDNATALQKQISAISTRMRSAGMHFVMIAQNLCEGKSYMLKDAFLRNATGRICFRVGSNVARDSGFEEEFVERNNELTALSSGEAYVSYGKNTIQKIKMAFASSEDMNTKHFKEIRNKYAYFKGETLIIGKKNRLTLMDKVRDDQKTYFDLLNNKKTAKGSINIVIGEDSYRMDPLTVRFTPNENSSLLLSGNDKAIPSSICTSIALSLARQDVDVHLFNGDRTRIQDDDDTYQHPFMYACKNLSSETVQVHKLSELTTVMAKIYGEYIKRQTLAQDEDEVQEYKGIFLVINDLFAIQSFVNNEMIRSDNDKASESINMDLSQGLFGGRSLFSESSTKKSGDFEEYIQRAMETLIKEGYRYNIHLIIGVKGDLSIWRANFIREINNIVLFNTTNTVEQLENSYFLREMLKNIQNDNQAETMGVLIRKRIISKIRPIIYKMSNVEEEDKLNRLLRG